MRKYSRRSSDCCAHVAMFGAMLFGLTLLTGCPDLCDIVPELCDGGGGGGGGGGDPTINLTGTWRINEADSSNCGGDGSTTGTWTVTQTGSSVTVRSVSRNITLSGTLTGNTLNLQGSFAEEGGITTVTRSNITVGPTGNTISGTETWRWSDGFDSCSGTTTISGSRL